MALEPRDTPERYGLVSRALHWSMAALFAWQFLGMILKKLAEDSAAATFIRGTHSSIGALLFLLVVIRAVWAFSNRRERPAHGTGLLGRAAAAGHFALYALMIIAPALALLRAYGSGRGLNFLGMAQIIPATGTRIDWMVAPASALHGNLSWLLLALIVGHITMVFVHRDLLRDNTMAKMAG
ncbi:MAG: cytochrome B [Rhodovulum sulfidophilum]|uniref:Cytochrome B n=1 Tax=Rhodovulum sulfidophilum TaxID=35806 RepID=A0A2W5Q465_RHOSU|nr:MAG: cytochrome B [Rhodovulum sulfidophilum]